MHGSLGRQDGPSPPSRHSARSDGSQSPTCHTPLLQSSRVSRSYSGRAGRRLDQMADFLAALEPAGSRRKARRHALRRFLLGSVVLVLVLGLGLVALLLCFRLGAVLLVSEPVTDAISDCIRYTGNLDLATTSESQAGASRSAVVSVPFFCSTILLPATAVARHVMDSFQVNVTDIDFDFHPNSTKTAPAGAITAFDAIFSARYGIKDPEDDTRGAISTAWSSFVRRRLVSSFTLHALSSDVYIDSEDSNYANEPWLAATAVVDTRSPLLVPLDGREGQVAAIPAAFSFGPGALPRLAELVTVWGRWIEDGNSTGTGPNPTRWPPRPIHLSVVVRGRVSTTLGPSWLALPLSIPKQTLTFSITLEPSDGVAGLFPDFKFTDFSLQPIPRTGADNPPGSTAAASPFLKHEYQGLTASATTEGHLSLSHPIFKNVFKNAILPSKALTHIPRVQLSASLENRCSRDRPGLPPDPLLQTANATASLSLLTSPPHSLLFRFTADASIRALPGALTRPCAAGSQAPLDLIVRDYLHGRGVTVHAHDARAAPPSPADPPDRYPDTPEWIPELLSGLAVAVRAPVPNPPVPLIQKLVLENVKLRLPRLGKRGLAGAGQPVEGEGYYFDSGSDSDSDSDSASDSDSDTELDEVGTPDSAGVLKKHKKHKKHKKEKRKKKKREKKDRKKRRNSGRDGLLSFDGTVLAYISLPPWPFPRQPPPPSSYPYSYSSASTFTSPSPLTNTLLPDSNQPPAAALDDILQVLFLRAPETQVFYGNSQLGLLNVSSWETASSRVVDRISDEDDDDNDDQTDGHRPGPRPGWVSEEPPEERRYLQIRADISRAPLKVTNRKLLSRLIHALMIRREDVLMSVDTEIDAAVDLAGVNIGDGKEVPSMDLKGEEPADPDSLLIVREIPASGTFIVHPQAVRWK